MGAKVKKIKEVKQEKNVEIPQDGTAMTTPVTKTVRSIISGILIENQLIILGIAYKIIKITLLLT